MMTDLDNEFTLSYYYKQVQILANFINLRGYLFYIQSIY